MQTPQPYLTTQTPSQEYSRWARHTGDDVSTRNRYLNVDPFASNRIHLRVSKGHSDYINASPIHIPPYAQLKSSQGAASDARGQARSNGKSGEDHYYIATQGPKEDAQSHIYRMIQQETQPDTHPAVIIMLTQTHESGREKCSQYYPASMKEPTMPIQESDPHAFDDDFHATLTLQSLTEDQNSRSTIREMSLAPTPKPTPTFPSPKKITHLLFAGWPDFLVPEGQDKIALLSLIKLSKERNQHSTTVPRIVHCSAGVGRSGTFIALDWLLDELEAGSFDGLKEGDDPIAEVVDHLRQQRMMMVQGESQFHFLYEVMREKFAERQQKLSGQSGSTGKSQVVQTASEENGYDSEATTDAEDNDGGPSGNGSGGKPSGGSAVPPASGSQPPTRGPQNSNPSRKL